VRNFGAQGERTKFWCYAVKIEWCKNNIGVQGVHIEYWECIVQIVFGAHKYGLIPKAL
jgi:hypothetical protein